DIKEALEFVQKNNIQKVFILGLGSNLIFTDDYFDGAVIQITNGVIPEAIGDPEVDSRLRGNDKKGFRLRSKNNISINDEGLVNAFAGEVLDDVIKFSFENNLTGLEWAGGLPGTVGAAVRGNVGAFGGEIKDSIEKVDLIDYSIGSSVLKTLTNQELEFVYRGSIVKTQKKMVVVNAYFSLKKANQEEIEKASEVYNKNKHFRRDHHPLEYPNCGSVFKNIRDREKVEKVLSVYPDLKESVEKKWYGKVAVASLIEKLGLKGFRIGNAQISEKHALFIVNLGGATNNDVRQIIDKVQLKFHNTFGFGLEVEVEIVN
ncbi:MAG TPA: UDP-N-acetylmuramate dehydrogenase, partial [Candidatus Saccharimonadales bacterium]|nr:UDP-N-acetylmuramate dehydrogenase [Candidatus Saccharimonadales bacterium]